MFNKQYLSSSMIAGLMRMFAEGLDTRYVLDPLHLLFPQSHTVASSFSISPSCSSHYTNTESDRHPLSVFAEKSSDSLKNIEITEYYFFFKSFSTLQPEVGILK